MKNQLNNTPTLFGIPPETPTDVQHYGVKGQKWGVITKGPNSTDHMSTKELQDIVNRMNLEKSYASLMEQQRPKGALEVAAGKTSEILVKAAEKSLQSYATKRMNALVDKYLPTP